MMKSSQAILTLFFVLAFAVSCSTRPSGVLKEDKMINLLKDMHKAEGVYSKDKRYTSLQQKDALLDAVFRKHKTTQEQFEKSLDWYAENIDLYNEITDTVSARLEREYRIDSDLLKDMYKYKLSGFTTILPDYIVLDNNNPTFRFKIDSLEMKNFAKESFMFAFQPIGIDTSLHKIRAMLYFTYADTLVIKRQEVEDDILYTLEKPNLPDSLLKEISGYIHIRNTNQFTPKLILSNISNNKAGVVNKLDSLDVPKSDKFEQMTTN